MRSKGFKTYKSLGQNFLVNPRIVEKIIQTADLKGDETVLEIGPGFGILTSELLKHCRRVIAIEKDERLYSSLPRHNKLTLVHADALETPPPNEPYVLIANIPYSITSPLLDHYIRDNPKNLPRRAVLLVQKEVAEKLCAAPSRMNVLALHIQTFGAPKIISIVSGNNFDPKPKVDSAIIKIEFNNEWKNIHDLEKYFANIHKAFGHKRKMLRASFDEELLKKAGIEPTRRPETLTLGEWQKLSI